MGQTIREIIEIWEKERAPLTAERTALITEQNNLLQKYKAKEEDGFVGYLKRAFDKISPFSEKNKTLKRQNALIDIKTNALKKHAQAAQTAAESIAMTLYRDPREDEQYNSISEIAAKVRAVRNSVNSASSKCQAAYRWEMSDSMTKSNGVSWISRSRTREAFKEVRDIGQKLSSLDQHLKICSKNLSELGAGIDIGNKFDLALDLSGSLGVDVMSAMNASKLRQAQESLDTISKRLDRFENSLQQKIQLRKESAIYKMRQKEKGADELLKSVSVYLASDGRETQRRPSP